MNFDPAQLSKLLWDAREAIEMLNDIVARRDGWADVNLLQLRDSVDAFRAEQGWSPNGFGGETDDDEEPKRAPEDRQLFEDRLIDLADDFANSVRDIAASNRDIADQLIKRGLMR